ncbi:MAG: AarF/ABC1/UbiB kinase family protein [Fibrobacterota bacterium]|nr:AarF/ABC1/UbiB kinase family protein [Fibrobacterota bacterium]
MIRNIRRLSKTYRNVNRFREILSVFVKHGFGDLSDTLHLDKYLDLGTKYLRLPPRAATLQLTRPERFRTALEELGPTFIKLGQMVGNRPDLLAPEWATELEKLQDAVPPFPTDEAKALVAAQFGKPMDALFTRFGNAPIASASMAQVYRAELPTGEQVAVKVQRPGIEETVKVDLEIMFHLAFLLEKYVQGMDVLNPLSICEEFERTIIKELDFSLEASQMERFAQASVDLAVFYVPRIHRAYTTRMVLTTEFMEGMKISNLEGIRHAGLDPLRIAADLSQVLMHQVFTQGFFHADPHPGNVLVLPDRTLCFLDYGMVGTLSPTHRDRLLDILVGVAAQDAGRIAKTLIQLAYQPTDIVEDLEYQVSEILETYSFVTLKDFRIGEFLNRLIRLIISNRLRMPPGFYLMLKAVVTLEGICRRLDPAFDMVEQIKPFAKKAMKARMRPDRLAKDMYFSALDLTPILKEFPAQARDILGLIKRGKLRIEFQHQGLEPILKTHERMMTRMVFALVLASLIIGSSLVVLSGIPPKWYGIPVIGVVGFLSAAFVGFWLLVSIILRKGSWK